MSEKSQNSTESVSPAKSSEVLRAPRVKRTFTAQFKEEALAMLSREGLRPVVSLSSTTGYGL